MVRPSCSGVRPASRSDRPQPSERADPRGAAGAYLFVLLQTVANTLQSLMPQVPTQLFPTLPFPLMILTLLLVAVGNAEWVQRALSPLPEATQRSIFRVLRALQTSPPAALGTTFEQE